MQKTLILSILLLVFLTACIKNPANPVNVESPYSIPIETGPAIDVYFCPYNNCTGILVNLFKNRSSADCALYSISNKDVLAAFTNIEHKRLVVDDENNKSLAMPFVRSDKEGRLSHNKFCIIDNTTIFTGSLNPTSALINDHNNILIISSPSLVDNYNAEFEELWTGTFGKGDKVIHPVVQYNNIVLQNYFCPEDDCKEHVLKELKAAKNSIVFMLYDLTDADIAGVLKEKNKAGISVHGMMDGPRTKMPYSQFKALKEAGISVAPEEEVGLLHHKVFIIDNITVITGSFNPTKNGNERNDENILILTDPSIASSFYEEYERIAAPQLE